MVLLLLALAAPLPVEQTEAATASATAESITLANGSTRTYRIFVPASYDAATPVPLLFAFHGGGGSARNIERQTNFDAVAQANGFIVVYPDGNDRRGGTTLQTWNAGGFCCGYAQSANIDDVGFVSALLDNLEAHYAIDSHRVYATGFSNGAMFTNWLGCQLADRIAAIAPVSGPIPLTSCAPARPLPVLAIHGTNDQHVPFTGGHGSESMPGTPAYPVPAEIAAGWAALDGCNPTPTVTTDGEVTTSTYGGCTDGVRVVFTAITGGGHAWPGGPKAGTADDASGLNASNLIWTFLSSYTLP